MIEERERRTIASIIFITNSLSYGGAQKMLCFLANQLEQRDYSVSVLNLLDNVEDAGRLNKNIQVTDICTSNIRYLDRVQQLNKIIRKIKSLHPDVIISFTFRPNYLATIAGKILNIPVIISERCDPSQEYDLKGRARIYWNIINQAEGGVFQTEGAMRLYSQRMQQRGAVIPNPVVLEESIIHQVKTNQTPRSIVSVGRLSNRQKRYDIMLKAFSIFENKHKGYTLILYGSGEDEENIRKWITDLGLDHSVFLLGKTDHPLKKMDEADVFLMTSDYEGISNSLLEAMAIGMPAIVTDCSPGGARLLIRDRENGLIVPCGDVERIAHALEELTGDPHLMAKCGSNARKVLMDYHPDAITERWIQYIHHVMDVVAKRRFHN